MATSNNRWSVNGATSRRRVGTGMPFTESLIGWNVARLVGRTTRYQRPPDSGDHRVRRWFLGKDDTLELATHMELAVGWATIDSTGRETLILAFEGANGAVVLERSEDRRGRLVDHEVAVDDWEDEISYRLSLHVMCERRVIGPLFARDLPELGLKAATSRRIVAASEAVSEAA
jgi:hypothetical protein